MVKNLPARQKTWVQSLGWEDPWRRKWQPTPVFLPEESQAEEQRSLGRGACRAAVHEVTKESAMT